MKLLKDRRDVINEGASDDAAGSRVVDHLKFMDLRGRPKRRNQKRVIDVKCNQGL